MEPGTLFGYIGDCVTVVLYSNRHSPFYQFSGPPYSNPSCHRGIWHKDDEAAAFHKTTSHYKSWATFKTSTDPSPVILLEGPYRGIQLDMCMKSC